MSGIDRIPDGYTVALTADAVRPDGSSVFGDLGLGRLVEQGIAWKVLPTAADPIPAEDLADVDAVWSMAGAHFDETLVSRLPCLRHIARFGAGYDTIDLAACSRAGIAVTNTPDGVRRPLALAAITLVLALAHSLPAKQRIAASGDWSTRGTARGLGVDGKVLGIVGFGNVGSELAELAARLGLTVVANNRRGGDARAEAAGVRFLPIDELLAASDYVVLTASLNADNVHLIDARRLALMRPTAFLVNVARGPLVDEAALVEALRARRVAGAALDVFETEPLPVASPLQGLDNVILTPHSLNWTEEFTDLVTASAIQAIVDVARGLTPTHLLNPEALAAPAWKRRLGR